MPAPPGTKARPPKRMGTTTTRTTTTGTTTTGTTAATATTGRTARPRPLLPPVVTRTTGTARPPRTATAPGRPPPSRCSWQPRRASTPVAGTTSRRLRADARSFCAATSTRTRSSAARYDGDHYDGDHGGECDDRENCEAETLAASGSDENAGNGAAAENGNGAGAPAPEPVQLETEESVDTVGGDDVEEAARRRAQLLRRYKIQEVIKRRQVMLVQVTKEERGNKGAALTTYLSLPGRYCVLMPNTNKGGGISRKISNASDRRRLKGILSELEIPEGIAVIVRTAGSQRTKVEIRRDYEYLLRLWDSIRQSTLQSAAPALIYEEANLIKRAIRDLYSRDMEEVLVDGEEGYKAAKDFMKSLTPSHAKKVQLYKDSNVPLFQRHQVESQLDAMHSNTVQLRSGGYLVFNQTEALVAVDVNSGRATRERHIEETALKTNLEAAEEIGRQLRLRDLAGLIVIDFIRSEAHTSELKSIMPTQYDVF